jgi:microcin C transport system substrate-binding protein
MKRLRGIAGLVLILVLAVAAIGASAEPRHGLSLFGDLKYPPNFTHFDYVNPDAPKGGTVKYAAIGTFDSLNPFTLKGQAAAGAGMVFDTLMSSAADEPASEYGLIAESAEVAPDRSWVIYTIRPEARFHDGSKITPEDVIWTFDTLKAKGHPRYRLYYADVLKAEKIGDRAVKFTFRDGGNRELPTIVGELPVLSKAYWADRDFEKTTLEAPLGSGPYEIDTFETGRLIAYRRVADYWGKDLPVNRGRFNFDTIRYDYYRDQTVALEAFKAGEYDIRPENVAKNWAIGYDGPALAAHLIKKEEIPNKLPQGMQGFGFNTRADHPFQDPRVRAALTYLFDFEWANKNLFFGAYTRSHSYFSNSEFAATGAPSPEELKLLEPWKGQIPDEALSKEYVPPKTDGSGNIHENLRAALKLFAAAGWSTKDGKLVNDKTGEQFTFEFLLVQPEFERVVLPFAQNVARIGAKMNVRTVDPAQYENRMRSFDFDMAVVGIGESLSPGNEQREYWSTASADDSGGANYMGIKSKAVDALVDLVINAPDRASLVIRTRALDRVLSWGHYVIPNWYLSYFRIASWDKFARPKISPPYGMVLDTWWSDPQRAQAVEAKKPQAQTK